MNLYLTRHTTPDLPRKICYGQTDLDVADTFHEEAEKTLNQLAGINYDLIYSSPLKRCSKLAEKINFKNKNIIYDDRLMEINFGDWELIKWTEIEKTNYGKSWFKDYVNTPSLNGESYTDLIERVKSFITRLKNDNATSPIIVCHGGVIRAFNSILNNIEPQKALEMKIEFGQIIKMNIDY